MIPYWHGIGLGCESFHRLNRSKVIHGAVEKVMSVALQELGARGQWALKGYILTKMRYYLSGKQLNMLVHFGYREPRRYCPGVVPSNWHFVHVVGD